MTAVTPLTSADGPRVPYAVSPSAERRLHTTPDTVSLGQGGCRLLVASLSFKASLHSGLLLASTRIICLGKSWDVPPLIAFHAFLLSIKAANLRLLLEEPHVATQADCSRLNSTNQVR